MAIVTINVSGRNATVRSPFEAKDLIKTLPVRSWSAEQKCWVIPAGDVEILRFMLKHAGFTVVVNGTPSNQRHNEPPHGNHTSTDTWADRMFVALGPDLSIAVYKALSRVLHPDTGGSTEHMKVLNAARDRHGRRS